MANYVAVCECACSMDRRFSHSEIGRFLVGCFICCYTFQMEFRGSSATYCASILALYLVRFYLYSWTNCSLSLNGWMWIARCVLMRVYAWLCVLKRAYEQAGKLSNILSLNCSFVLAPTGDVCVCVCVTRLSWRYEQQRHTLTTIRSFDSPCIAVLCVGVCMCVCVIHKIGGV